MGRNQRKTSKSRQSPLSRGKKASPGSSREPTPPNASQPIAGSSLSQVNTSRSLRPRLSRRKQNSSGSTSDKIDSSVERTPPNAPQPIAGPTLSQVNTLKSCSPRLSQRKKASSGSRRDKKDSSREPTPTPQNAPQPINAGPSLRGSSTLEPASRLKGRPFAGSQDRVCVSVTLDSENEGTNSQQPVKRLKRIDIPSPDITQGHLTLQGSSGRRTDRNRIRTMRSNNAGEAVVSCTASDSQPQVMEVSLLVSEAILQPGGFQSGTSEDQSPLVSNIPSTSSQLLRSGFGWIEEEALLHTQCTELQASHLHLSPYLDKAQARRIPVVTKTRKKKTSCTATETAHSCSDSGSQNLNVVVESVSVENNPHELQVNDVLHDCGIKTFDSVPDDNSYIEQTNGGEDLENEDGLKNEAGSKPPGKNVGDEALNNGDERKRVDVVDAESRDSNMENIEDIVEDVPKDSNMGNIEDIVDEKSQDSDQENIENDQPFVPNLGDRGEDRELVAIDQGNSAEGDEERNQKEKTGNVEGDMEDLHAADQTNNGEEVEEWYDVETEEQGYHPPHINSLCRII